MEMSLRCGERVECEWPSCDDEVHDSAGSATEKGASVAFTIGADADA